MSRQNETLHVWFRDPDEEAKKAIDAQAAEQAALADQVVSPSLWSQFPLAVSAVAG